MVQKIVRQSGSITVFYTEPNIDTLDPFRHAECTWSNLSNHISAMTRSGPVTRPYLRFKRSLIGKTVDLFRHPERTWPNLSIYVSAMYVVKSLGIHKELLPCQATCEIFRNKITFSCMAESAPQKKSVKQNAANKMLEMLSTLYTFSGEFSEPSSAAYTEMFLINKNND